MSAPNRLTTKKHWTLPALLASAGVRAEVAHSPNDVTITTLTDDSRAVMPGACFVAVRGCGCDGHDYLESAIGAGASAVVIDRDVPVSGGAAVVRVADARDALARLAATFVGVARRKSNPAPLRIVGVTGTNGKTTIAWLLRSIFQAARQPTALFGTIEYDLVSSKCKSPLTTPGAVELCRHLATAQAAGATHAVLEVSSHALDQRRTDGLSFAAGVFTNLTGDHIDYHGSVEAYLAAKRRLFEQLGADAVAVVNADDPADTAVTEGCIAPVVSYGIESPRADVTARIHEMDLRGSAFSVTGPDWEMELWSPLIGAHNVVNALAAAATAHALGAHSDAIREGLASIKGVPGRLQRVEPDACPFSVLVDYAHSDDALEHVLDAVRPLTPGRLLCVFGCGGDRDRTKRPRMAAAVGRHADVAYVTSDNPRTEDPDAIVREIVTGFSADHGCRVVTQVDRGSAIELAIEEAREGDTVLIAGKGHEPYQIVGDKVLVFDDVEVARNCLSQRAVVTENVA